MGLFPTGAAFNLLALGFGVWFFLIVAGVFVLFWISIFIVSLAETRTVHEWDPAVGPREPGPYGQAMIAQAKSVGFTPGGTYAHRKFDLTATFLLSPDRTVAAGVYDGTMLKMPVKRTKLYTFTADGRALTSTDEVIPFPDRTKTFDEDFLLHADFYELHDHHVRRLDLLRPAVAPLASADDICAAVEALERRMIDRMAEMGLVYFTDPQRDRYRSTFRGAVQNVTAGINNKASTQANRTKLPRPGSDKYVARGFPVLPAAGVAPVPSQRANPIPPPLPPRT